MSLFKLIVSTFIASTSLISSAIASEPVISISGDQKTYLACEKIPFVSKGTILMVPVTIENIAKTHSYSFTIQFDDKVVSFDGASKSSGWRTPGFLETCGGNIAAFLTCPKENKIEIATTVSGNDSLTMVSGNGILAVLKFTAMTDGDPSFKIIKAKFLDLHGTCIYSENN